MKTRLLITQFVALMVCGLTGPRGDDSDQQNSSTRAPFGISTMVRTTALSKGELETIKDLEKQRLDAQAPYMHLQVAWFVLSAVLLPLTLFAMYSLGQQYLKLA